MPANPFDKVSRYAASVAVGLWHLGGPEVDESQVVNEWKAGAAGGAVVAVLEARFGSVPPSLAAAIRADHDLSAQRRWVRDAAAAPTLPDFRAAAEVPAQPFAPGRRADGTESALVQEFMAEAEQECVLQVLDVRFGPVPPDVFVRVCRTRCRLTLRGWLAVAATCPALDEFRQRTVSLGDVIRCQFGRVPPDVLEHISRISDWPTTRALMSTAMRTRTLAEFRAAIGLAGVE